MITPVNRIMTGLIGLAFVAIASVKASPVTVEELGMKAGAYQVVGIHSTTTDGWSFSGDVYAGVIKLDVNGTPMQGFCIDPWHLSAPGVLDYDLRTLALAPAWPGPMGSAAAAEIEKLWSHYYSAGIDADTAAALQIEIWKITDAAVADGTFQLTSASGTILAKMGLMEAWLGGDISGAPAAWLSAVVSMETDGAVARPPRKLGQDYVIPGVPDGGWTVALVGLGLLGLCLVRRRATGV